MGEFRESQYRILSDGNFISIVGGKPNPGVSIESAAQDLMLLFQKTENSIVGEN